LPFGLSMVTYRLTGKSYALTSFAFNGETLFPLLSSFDRFASYEGYPFPHNRSLHSLDIEGTGRGSIKLPPRVRSQLPIPNIKLPTRELEVLYGAANGNRTRNTGTTSPCDNRFTIAAMDKLARPLYVYLFIMARLIVLVRCFTIRTIVRIVKHKFIEWHLIKNTSQKMRGVFRTEIRF
jgi:hypothetical protein